MKRISLLMIFSISLVLLVGCFGSNSSTTLPNNQTSTSTTATTLTTLSTIAPQHYTYEDFQNIYDKTYYNLLSDSLYNQTLADQYGDINFIDFVNDMVDSYMNDESPVDMPDVTELEKSEFLASELSTMDMDTFATNFGVTGPFDILYTNLASVQYFLDLVEELNANIEDYGTIDFDGSEISIPAGDYLSDISDPLVEDQYLELNDLVANYSSEGNTLTMLLSTVNDYTYSGVLPDSEVTGDFSGEVGVYLEVSVTIDGDIYTVQSNFYITLSLSAIGGITSVLADESVSVDLLIGYSMTAIDQDSVVINTQFETTVNVDLEDNSAMDDIDETVSEMTSFIVANTDDGTIADYKVSTDALTDADISYHIFGDDEDAYLYLGASIVDQEFYGEDIPAQSVQGIIIYHDSEPIFAGCQLQLNLPDYDEYGVYTGTEPFNYYLTGWNFNNLSGWTSIEEDLDDYIVYNGTTVLISKLDQDDVEDEDGNLVSEMKVFAGAISIDTVEYDMAVLLTIHEGTEPTATLPTGITSTDLTAINAQFTNLDDVQAENCINFSLDRFLVPELDEDLYS